MKEPVEVLLMLPTSMKGDGYYKAHSLIQRKVIDLSLPLIKEAAARIPLPPETEAFCLADYGCGQGKNSLVPIAASIDAVRARRAGQSISVIHNDLPSNDFNSLLKDIHCDSQDSYLMRGQAEESKPGQIFVLVSATSFYEQVAPSAAVKLGLSYSAMHWLKNLPAGSVKDDIWQWGASPQELDAISGRAAHDWLTILRQRARELAPGSRLVVSMAGALEPSEAKPEGWHGDLFSAYKPARLLDQIIKEMVDEKLIDRARYESFCMPFYERTVAELLKPLQDEGSPVHGLFEVEHARAEAVNCPLYEDYRKTGDLHGYASEVAATVRAFTEPFVIAGLLSGHKSNGGSLTSAASKAFASEDCLADEIYERMRKAVESRPQAHAFNIVQTMTVLHRV